MSISNNDLTIENELFDFIDAGPFKPLPLIIKPPKMTRKQKNYRKYIWNLLIDDYKKYFSGFNHLIFDNWKTRYNQEMWQKTKGEFTSVDDYFSDEHCAYINELRDKAIAEGRWMKESTDWELKFFLYATQFRQGYDPIPMSIEEMQHNSTYLSDDEEED